MNQARWRLRFSRRWSSTKRGARHPERSEGSRRLRAVIEFCNPHRALLVRSFACAQDDARALSLPTSAFHLRPSAASCSMTNVEKTPLFIGLRAARANLVPGLIIQTAMISLVLAY